VLVFVLLLLLLRYFYYYTTDLCADGDLRDVRRREVGGGRFIWRKIRINTGPGIVCRAIWLLVWVVRHTRVTRQRLIRIIRLIWIAGWELIRIVRLLIRVAAIIWVGRTQRRLHRLHVVLDIPPHGECVGVGVGRDEHL
jgi:hypothetical protein